MSERDDRYARNNLPNSTAEFRATPDISASTAQFRAFASARDTGYDQPRQDTGSWPEQPWAGEAPSGGSGRPVALIVAGVVVVAIAVAVLFFVG
ncbi:MAG TPA: hypothetical protein VNF47_06560 [Streptosporangiaceae bacterium]|nr:hypothetical protein [Streptosporangiaceae bacterium]